MVDPNVEAGADAAAQAQQLADEIEQALALADRLGQGMTGVYLSQALSAAQKQVDALQG